MNNADDNSSASQVSAVLHDYCLRVIRYLADSAMDPHRYFEQKYCGDVAAARTDEALIRIVVSLADWSREISMSETSLAAFDRTLQADDLPSFSMICHSKTRAAGLVLAKGRITSAADSRLVRDFLHNATPDNTDRPCGVLRIREYEQH